VAGGNAGFGAVGHGARDQQVVIDKAEYYPIQRANGDNSSSAGEGEIYSTNWLTNIDAVIIFNCMVEYSDDDRLSLLLKAVSDGTRRALLTQLCQQGSSRVTDLATHYDMSLNAISKHIKVLEKAGLVTRTTSGRTHLIQADLGKVELMSTWLGSLKSIWALSLDKFDEVISDKKGENR
jgi:DNA-binding transcriptional ArsR family regulator